MHSLANFLSRIKNVASFWAHAICIGQMRLLGWFKRFCIPSFSLLGIPFQSAGEVFVYRYNTVLI